MAFLRLAAWHDRHNRIICPSAVRLVTLQHGPSGLLQPGASHR